MSSLEEFEIYAAFVLFGKVKEIAKALDYIRKFCDVKVVFDKKAPYKLYITEVPPKEAKQ